MPVLTTPFRAVADRLLSFWKADRPLPVVVLDHPMQNVDGSGLDSRARQLADAVEGLLGAGT